MVVVIQIAICDDIPTHSNDILNLLDCYQKERPGVLLCPHSFDCANKLLEYVKQSRRFDIFLLDVIMPNTDGIELAKQIRLYEKDVPLVFLTQSTSYALDAFGVCAAQYILKPVSKDALFSVLDKIIAALSREEDSFISISAPGRIVNMMYSSIVLVESARRTLRFHLTTGDLIESKTIRTPFESAVSELLKDERFLCVHQSFVINMDQVSELRSKLFVMQNGIEVFIPRPKYAAIKKAYLTYLSKSMEFEND